MYVCMYYVCMYVCIMYVLCMYYVCMYVCIMYVPMYVRMYVCMYVRTYVATTGNSSTEQSTYSLSPTHVTASELLEIPLSYAQDPLRIHMNSATPSGRIYFTSIRYKKYRNEKPV